jgi:hypothetical protein
MESTCILKNNIESINSSLNNLSDLYSSPSAKVNLNLNLTFLIRIKKSNDMISGAMMPDIFIIIIDVLSRESGIQKDLLKISESVIRTASQCLKEAFGVCSN